LSFSRHNFLLVALSRPHTLSLRRLCLLRLALLEILVRIRLVRDGSVKLVGRRRQGRMLLPLEMALEVLRARDVVRERAELRGAG